MNDVDVCRVNSWESKNKSIDTCASPQKGTQNSSITKTIEQKSKKQKSKKQKNKANKGINQVKPNKQAEQADDELCFKVWNIFGLKQSKINKIKNKTDKFLNDMFKTSDFVVFTETWGESSDSDLTGMMSLKKKIREYGRRNSKRGRSSGGISFYARKKLERDYEILSSDSYRIWLKINKSLYNGKDDIIMFSLRPTL